MILRAKRAASLEKSTIDTIPSHCKTTNVSALLGHHLALKWRRRERLDMLRSIGCAGLLGLLESLLNTDLIHFLAGCHSALQVSIDASLAFAAEYTHLRYIDTSFHVLSRLYTAEYLNNYSGSV